MEWFWRVLQQQILIPILKIAFYCWGTDFSIWIPKNFLDLEITLEVRRTMKEKVLGDISKGRGGERPLLKHLNTLHIFPSKLVGRHEFTKGKKGSREEKG